MSRRIRALCSALILLALTSAVPALVKNITPLRTIVASQEMIFEARVEKIDPEKPALYLTAGAALKGKVPFKRMPVNMTGDRYAKQEKHPELLLKRLAAGLDVLVFAGRRGPDYEAFVYTNGSWFQIKGVGEPDDPKWGLVHGEPYLRRTFKGTTAELKKAIEDGLAGKPVPDPDEKEKPGFGPEVKPADQPAEPGKPPLSYSSTPLPFAVAPTFLLVGPLALLATLFPTVFGGLALIMKRWMAALSICCTLSTVWFLHGWFFNRLSGTWLGSPARLWLVLGTISVMGALWAGRRYRKAIAAGDLDTFTPRRWDRIVLVALSFAGAAGLTVAAYRNMLLRSPWLDLLALMVPVWATAVASLRQSADTPGVVSFESVFLWALVFACFNVAALETGRGEGGTTFQQLSSTGGRGPRPVGKLWERTAPTDGKAYPTPLAAGDRVYVGAVQASRGFTQLGNVYALDASTGAVLWTFDDSGRMRPLFSSPVLADGRIYIGEGFHQDSDCKLFCLDARDGKKLWEFPTQSHTESTPVVVDGRVYFGAGDDGVYCLDAKTGEKVWNYPDVHVDSRPLVAAGRLYVGSGVGDIHKTTVLLCLDVKDGKEVWKVPIDLPAFAPPVLAGEHVFFGIGNGNMDESDPDNPRGAVLCVEAKSGKRVWQADARDAVLMEAAVDNDSIYFSSRDGHVYCVSRAEGRPRWKRALGGPVVAAPTLVGAEGEFGTVRSLYVASTTGRVECLNVDTGEPYWSLDLSRMTRMNAKVSAAPTVVVRNDGGVERRRIYIAATLTNAQATSTLARWYCFEDEIK